MLLHKTQREKLTLLYLLYENDGTTQNLAKRLAVTKRKLLKIVKDLNEEIEHQCQLPAFLEISPTGELSICANYQAHFSVFSRLKYAYLQQNYDFQVLAHLFQQPATTYRTLARDLFLSESYMRRLVKTINQKLAVFHFSIKETAHKTLDFEGNELAVRLFLYFMLHDLDPVLSAEVAPSRNLFELRVDMTHDYFVLYALFNVLNKRNNDHHLMPLPDPSLVPLLQVFQEQVDVLQVFAPFLTFDTAFLTDTTEMLYLSFFSHIFFSNLIEEPTKVHLGKLFQNRPEAMVQFADQLIEAADWALTLPKTTNQRQILRYYLVLLGIYDALLTGMFDHFLTLLLPIPQGELQLDTEKRQHIHAFFTHFLATQPANGFVEAVRKSSTMQAYYCGILYAVMEPTPAPIQLYIAATKDFTAKAFIIKRLRKVYTEEILVFCETPEQADLMITDHINTPESNAKIFLLNSLFDPQHWQKLMAELDQLIVARLF